jgi:hypothetical protein
MSSTDPPAPPLPDDLLKRQQEAQVLQTEANARKAALDAESASWKVTQDKYKSFVPDLTSVATNAVTDSSTGVAYSGLVTYSALGHAAEMIAEQVHRVLAERRTTPGQPDTASNSDDSKLGDPSSQATPESGSGEEGPAVAVDTPTILVTSQSDLLTNDLLARAVEKGLEQATRFADHVLEIASGEVDRASTDQPVRARIAFEAYLGAIEEPASAALLGNAANAAAAANTAAVSGAGAAAAIAAGAASGPVGLAAAAVSAIPSILSLFSSTTTVKSHDEELSDLSATTAVVGALLASNDACVVAHEDFRLSPDDSHVQQSYDELTAKRAALLIMQEKVQGLKNAADMTLAQAQVLVDAAQKETPPRTDDQAVENLEKATFKSANAGALLSLMAAALTGIDSLVTSVNSVAAGSRSPLAIAILNESLREPGQGALDFVLAVKGLGGQSEEYTKDRHVGVDTYTSLADASISYMLFDVGAKAIVKAGLTSGVSSVHGTLGKPPRGLVGPNVMTAVEDEQAAEGETPESPDSLVHTAEGAVKRGWRRIFG